MTHLTDTRTRAADRQLLHLKPCSFLWAEWTKSTRSSLLSRTASKMGMSKISGDLGFGWEVYTEHWISSTPSEPITLCYKYYRRGNGNLRMYIVKRQGPHCLVNQRSQSFGHRHNQTRALYLRVHIWNGQNIEFLVLVSPFKQAPDRPWPTVLYTKNKLRQTTISLLNGVGQTDYPKIIRKESSKKRTELAKLWIK